MPAISLGFGEVEERLQQTRRRLNSLSLQHVTYLSGSLIVLLGALLVVVELRAPPYVLRPYLVGYALAVCAIGATAAFRLRARWLSLDGIARLADREATLESRLSTLCAHRPSVRRSKLRGLLLAQTLALAPRWDRSALAPRRVPRSIYLLLGSLALLAGTSWFVPPRQAESSIAGNSTPATAPEDESVNFDKQPMDASAANVPPSRENTSGANGNTVAGKGADGKGAGLAHGGGAPALAGQGTDPASLYDSVESGEHDGGVPGDLANADAGQEKRPLGEAAGRNPDGSEARRKHGTLGEAQRDTPDRHPSTQSRSATGEKTTHLDQRAKQNPDTTQGNTDGKARSQAEVGSSATKGGAKPSGKIGSPMNDPLYENGKASLAQNAEVGKPGTFTLQLSRVAASAPSDFEPQNKKPQEGARGFGLGQASPPQTRVTGQQVEDDPLQKAQISPEHESLLRRIFQRD